MWLKVSEYAKKHGIRPDGVRRKIKRNTIASRKDERGITLVEDADDDISALKEQSQGRGYSQQALETRWDVENELKRKKIENIRADIVLKKQKSVLYRDKLRTEFCEGVLEAYTDAFAGLKSVVVAMKLKKDDIRKFKEVYSKCLKKFEEKLVAYLKQKDIEEEKEAEDEGAEKDGR